MIAEIALHYISHVLHSDSSSRFRVSDHNIFKSNAMFTI